MQTASHRAQTSGAPAGDAAALAALIDDRANAANGGGAASASLSGAKAGELALGRTHGPGAGHVGSMQHHQQVDTSRELAATQAGNLFRSLVVDHSLARTGAYVPEKVTRRNQRQVSTRSEAQIMAERDVRRTALATCGFASNPKRAYRTLGQPILNPMELVFSSLQVDPNGADIEFEAGEVERLAEMKERERTSNTLTSRLRSINVPTHATLDYQHIKDHLGSGVRRFQMVKFGTSLAKALAVVPAPDAGDPAQTAGSAKDAENRSRRHVWRVAASDAEAGALCSLLDWNNLVFNAEHQAQVMAHIEVRRQAETQQPVDNQQAAKTSSGDSGDAAALSGAGGLETDGSASACGTRPGTSAADEKGTRRSTQLFDSPSMAEISALLSGSTPDTVELDQQQVAHELLWRERLQPGSPYHRRVVLAAAYLQDLQAKASGATQFSSVTVPMAVTAAAAGLGNDGRSPASGSESSGAAGASGQLLPTEVEALERHLCIHRTANSLQTMESLFAARDAFYDQRQYLSTALEETLGDITQRRQGDITERFAALRISTGLGSDNDVENMRAEVDRNRRHCSTERLAAHPWYRVLAPRVLYPPSGVPNRQLSPYEALLDSRIARAIVNDEPLNTVAAVAALCRGIPKAAFAQEAVQRIVRFVKSQEKLGEQEYLAALEAAGQGHDEPAAYGTLGNAGSTHAGAVYSVKAALSDEPRSD